MSRAAVSKGKSSVSGVYRWDLSSNVNLSGSASSRSVRSSSLLRQKLCLQHFARAQDEFLLHTPAKGWWQELRFLMFLSSEFYYLFSVASAVMVYLLADMFVFFLAFLCIPGRTGV